MSLFEEDRLTALQLFDASIKPRVGLHHDRRCLSVDLVDDDLWNLEGRDRFAHPPLPADHQRKATQLALGQEDSNLLGFRARAGGPLALDRSGCSCYTVASPRKALYVAYRLRAPIV